MLDPHWLDAFPEQREEFDVLTRHVNHFEDWLSDKWGEDASRRQDD